MTIRHWTAAGLLLCGLDMTAATATAKKKAPHKSTKAAASVAKPKTGRARGKRGKRLAKKAPPRRWTQQAPSPERYKEIQRALADKGYYKGEVNGAWGPESVEALRNYQREQKLEGDGKLNSLSLIGLGLGPKRSLTAKADTAGRP